MFRDKLVMLRTSCRINPEAPASMFQEKRALLETLPEILSKLEKEARNCEAAADEERADHPAKRSRRAHAQPILDPAEVVSVLVSGSVLFPDGVSPHRTIVETLDAAMKSSYAAYLLDDNTETVSTIRRMIYVCFRKVVVEELHKAIGNRASAVRIFSVLAGLADVRTIGTITLSESVNVDAMGESWRKMVSGSLDRVLQSFRSTKEQKSRWTLVQCLVSRDGNLFNVLLPAEWLPESIIQAEPLTTVQGPIRLHTLDPSIAKLIGALQWNSSSRTPPGSFIHAGYCALKCGW